MKTGQETEKNSHLITAASNQSTVINGDKPSKARDSSPNVLGPKRNIGDSKSPKMEKNSTDVAQLNAGSKSAPRLPPKPSNTLTIDNNISFDLKYTFLIRNVIYQVIW